MRFKISIGFCQIFQSTQNIYLNLNKTFDKLVVTDKWLKHIDDETVTCDWPISSFVKYLQTVKKYTSKFI
jgi:hypothetical protein